MPLHRLGSAAIVVAAVFLAAGACSGHHSWDDPYCSIDDRATTCAGELTVFCYNGTVPSAAASCRLDDPAVSDHLYCCPLDAFDAGAND